MTVRKVVDISDRLNIWFKKTFGEDAKRKVLEAKSPTFCPYPFMHLVINNSGGYSQCCEASQEIYKTTDGELVTNDLFSSDVTDNVTHGATLQEVFYGEHIDSVRQQLVAGEKPKSCSRCWANEARSFHSARKSSIDRYILENNEFRYDVKDIIKNPQIRSLDLKFSNKCNLYCVMCNSGNSDQWEKQDKKIIKYLKKAVDVDPLNSGQSSLKWDDIVRPGHETRYGTDNYKMPAFSPKLFEEIKSLVPRLHEIQVTGGEPFISKEFITLLKYIIRTGHANHITLEITTNGTKFVTDVMELLIHFRHVRFEISIDGSGDAYDYVRPPFTYELLLERLQFLNQYIESGKLSAEIEIVSLAMVYNLFSFSQLDYDIRDCLNIRSLGRKTSNITPMLNEGEDRLLIKWLPKEILIEALYEYIENSFGTSYPGDIPELQDLLNRVLDGTDVYINFNWIKALVSYIRDDVDEDIAATKHRELKNYTVLMDKIQNRKYRDYLHPRIADFLDSIDADLADAN